MADPQVKCEMCGFDVRGTYARQSRAITSFVPRPLYFCTQDCRRDFFLAMIADAVGGRY